MINFTVGPVMSNRSVREIGSEQVPYFRTPEFSRIMFENESMILNMAKAQPDGKVCFLTGSGTAAMEAAIVNSFDSSDKVIVIDGGTFGHRFVELLEIYGIPHSIINPSFGCDITEEQLSAFDGKGFTGFLVNLDETSIGVLYNINLISDFCRRNSIFLIVDSISSFLCDPFDMDQLGVQIMIAGSQKALACPPGISLLVLSPEAIKRINEHNPQTLYFDLKRALKDGERGQTPFTPAVGILRQIHQRLMEIENSGGVEQEIIRISELASYFRNKVVELALPFSFTTNCSSNAVTALSTHGNTSANTIVELLKTQYGIWVCPNGGTLADKVFRVGHIGDLSLKDYDVLLNAFTELRDKKYL